MIESPNNGQVEVIQMPADDRLLITPYVVNSTWYGLNWLVYLLKAKLLKIMSNWLSEVGQPKSGFHNEIRFSIAIFT